MTDTKIVVAKFLAQHIQLDERTLYDLLELPKQAQHGDFALPCFMLAKQHKQPPHQIAQSTATVLQTNKPDTIQSVQAVGPYINIHLNKAVQAKQLITPLCTDPKSVVQFKTEKPLRYALEYPAPNTNKPLHLGHAKLMFLGKSLTTILSNAGHEVITVNLNNDRGVHICKSMLAYKLFGDNKQPDKKPDHFVGQWYVRFKTESDNNPDLEQQAQDMLELWEQGDEETRKLWHTMRQWCLEGFAQTYKEFDISFNKEYFESDFYDKAKQAVLEATKKGVFTKRDDGAIIATFDNEEQKLPEKVVLRSNGTTVYMTQDIYLAKLRYEDYKMDAMVYFVGNEQNLHFQQLFAILKQLGEPYADRCVHIATGMIDLPSGKMKSREGTVVDADDLLVQIRELAKQEVSARQQNLEEQELQRRADIIAKAAVRFYMLKYNPKADFTFNPKESLSFDGETGPYVLYTYARIQSLLAKATLAQDQLDTLTDNHEVAVINILAQAHDVIKEASEKLAPYVICHYLISVCQTFNSFYHACHVAGEPNETARAALCLATANTIKHCLSLLNIDVLEQM